jgi:hypothetical protein
MAINLTNGGTHGRQGDDLGRIFSSEICCLSKATAIEEAMHHYEAERREATARIVLMNRKQGPDKVLDLAKARLEQQAESLNELLPMAERTEILGFLKVG